MPMHHHAMLVPVQHVGEAATPDAAAGSTVSHMLERIGAEISRAADDMHDLQDVLSPMLSGHHEPAAMMQIQNIDLLEQTLRDLEVVLAQIATMPAVAQPLDLDAIAKLCKLADLAKRFCSIPTDTASTDVELF